MTPISSIAKILALLSLIQAVMCTPKAGVSPDPKDFFAKDIDGNLTKVTWAHAVNSKEKLQKTLLDVKIMMLEADVLIGTLNDTGVNATEIPIMAHPPETMSDLSLEEFLESVLGDGKRGIKLDFKSIEAFNMSRPILEKYRANLTFPVWLNADILVGPVDANPKDPMPVDPMSFLAGAAASLPESTLSVGWTTRYGEKFNITSGNYTEEQVKKMAEVLSQSKTKQPVTYPVRAGIAASSANVLTNLLKDTAVHNPTLTIWSSEKDAVDAVALSKLIKEIGVEKVYVDVPAELMSKLDISGAPSLAKNSIILVASVLATLAVKLF